MEDGGSKTAGAAGNQPEGPCESKQAVGGRGKRMNGYYSHAATLPGLEPGLETGREIEGRLSGRMGERRVRGGKGEC